jgi:hypothetical protein
MIGEGGTFTLSNLLLYVCQPALAIKAFCVFSDTDWEIVNSVNKLTLLRNFGLVAVITVLSMGVVFALCKLVFIKAKDKKSADVYSYIAVFSNCGFLGIPFIEMFTDGNPIAVIYMMVFSVVFNILCWTLGVVLITGDFREISVKKILLNPVIIANVLGVIIFFVPQINIFMFEGLEELQIFPKYLATMTAPLSMVIVGIRLAESSPKALFARKGVYLAGALRLVIAPFITIAITIPFWGILGKGVASGYEEYVYMAPIIAMAMSPAASVVAMAERFDGDKDTATAAFVTNTIISIITIPLVITAASLITGVGV